MPWNEPGSGNKDPWSKKPRDQGPPDLDELLRKLSSRFGGLFGGKGGAGGGVGGGGGVSKGSSIGIGVIGGILLIGWLISGFYIVGAGEAGVELRFGAFRITTGPGPHWHIPYPIETVEIVNVTEIRSAQHKATMLTQDENIVDVELAVQYLVKSPEDYVFQVRLPDASLRQAMESAVREVVGKSKMDYILAEGRAQIADDTKQLLQTVLDDYKTGLLVTTMNMQQAQPPEQVQDAFADAIKAREDEVRFRNEAEAYSNGIIPQARGEAARIEQEASAYQSKVMSKAEGESARFLKLLAQYAKAPNVTRERLFLDAVESVLSSSSKVLVDIKQGNNLLVLPLDKIMTQGSAASMAQAMDRTGVTQRSPTGGAMDNRTRRSRVREGR